METKQWSSINGKIVFAKPADEFLSLREGGDVVEESRVGRRKKLAEEQKQVQSRKGVATLRILADLSRIFTWLKENLWMSS